MAREKPKTTNNKRRLSSEPTTTAPAPRKKVSSSSSPSSSSQAASSNVGTIDGFPAEVAAHLIGFLPWVDRLSLRCASSLWLALVHGACPALRRDVKVAALRGLSRNLKQESLFSCGGTTRLTEPLQLFFNRQQTTGKEEKRCGKGSCQFLSFPLNGHRKNSQGRGALLEEEGEALKELIECCWPATFGRGSKEVLDSSYRDALQLSPALFTTNFHVSEYDILDKIKRVIMPQSWRIRAELYKLNIYAAGGHFKAHVDTPRGDGMFGSLVVCLPTSFKGGQLQVRHSGLQVVFPLGGDNEHEEEKEEEGGETSCEVKWAAFYSDCEHEILPVTEGHRITLTYNLYSDVKTMVEESNMAEKGTSMENKQKKQYVDGSKYQQSVNVTLVRRKFEGMLLDEDCFPEGVTLAFQCKHSYACEEFSRAPDPSSLLKGFDALVHEAAVSLGLKTSLKCFFTHQIEWFKASGPSVLLMCDTFPKAVSLLPDLCVGNEADYTDLQFLRDTFPSLHLLVDAIPLNRDSTHPGLLERRAKRLIGVMVTQFGHSERSARQMLKAMAQASGNTDACQVIQNMPASKDKEEEEEEEEAEEEEEEEEEQEQEEEEEEEAEEAEDEEQHQEGKEKEDDGQEAEDDEEEEELRDLPKKAVQWCTDKPVVTRDTLVAVTAAWGNEPSVSGFYVSALLLVEMPCWDERSP